MGDDDALLTEAGRASAVRDLAHRAEMLGRAALATAEALRDETAARVAITKRYDRMIRRATIAIGLLAGAFVLLIVVAVWNRSTLTKLDAATNPASKVRAAASTLAAVDEIDCRFREALAGIAPHPKEACLVRSPAFRRVYPELTPP